ncbi:hypothetical protein [Pseudomonas graminis]|uniref:RiboL-PSP-HEPN domain-containing protein n=1 Tax=Pseudomonas graminis TaxID=158627 RepID=A0A1I0HYN8_9PSED|nr:hypothetical protein [Pseudomonas graminis]SET89445.1 hypothetical protein SAMN05216197_13114 [Pseudomonas graminis]
MRKADSDTAYLKFEREHFFLLDFYVDSVIALREHSSKDSYASKLAELCFHKMYVSFEVYLSDLFVALVNIDPSQYQRSLHASALRSMEAGVPEWLKERISFKTEKHIKLDDVRHLLDATQANITFKSVKDLKAKAKKWLSKDLAKPFQALRPEDEALFQAAIAMRNFVAHESTRARIAMNEALRDLGNYEDHADLKISSNDVRAVGAYLKSTTFYGPRLISFIIKLGDLAVLLNPDVRKIRKSRARSLADGTER